MIDALSAPLWSTDGKRLFFVRWGELDVWALSLEDRRERQIADLKGGIGEAAFGFRPGRSALGALEEDSLAADSQYLYFAWEQEVGDIWVMDVVTDEDS